MSTTTLAAPIRVNTTGVHARPGLGRLVAVELRKMVNTRAGFWLQLATVAITVLVVIVACVVGDAADLTFQSVLNVGLQPAAVLLPVVGILLVTSEWTQRTSLITFTLVPQRSRVLVAKLLAGGALGLIGYQICLATGLLATAVFGGDAGDTWSFSAALLGQNALSVVLAMLAGIGFGAVLLASAPAIVLFFVLPTAWGAIGSISAFEGAARWLDQSRTMADMGERALSGTEWARVGTSVALWVLLPIVIGFWRVRRNDVR